MLESTNHASQVRQFPMFGIVAVLASATIAILIAADAVDPYPTTKLAYLTCAVMGLIGLIHLAYTIGSAKPS